jgi:hypothetical protein
MFVFDRMGDFYGPPRPMTEAIPQARHTGRPWKRPGCECDGTGAPNALVVAAVEGSGVLMFVTVGFVALAIGAFSNFVGYRIRRQDGRRGAR